MGPRIDDEDRALLGPDGGLVTAFRQFGAAGSGSLGPAELLATAAAVGDDSAESESMVGALLDEVGNAGGRLELSQFAAMLHDAEGAQLAQDSTPEPVTRRRDEPEPVQEVAEEEQPPVGEESVEEEPQPEPEPDFEPEPEPEPDLEAEAEPQAQGRNDEAHLVSFIDVLAQMSRMDDGGGAGPSWAKIWQGQEEDEHGDADDDNEDEGAGKPRVSAVFPVAFDWGSVDPSASYRWARGQKGKAEKL